MNPTKEDIEKYWESKKKHLVHDINIINEYFDFGDKYFKPEIIRAIEELRLKNLAEK